MPGKAGFPHPEVEVRCVHARDVHPILPGYCVQDGVQTVDVPFPYTRISEGPRDVRTVLTCIKEWISLIAMLSYTVFVTVYMYIQVS